MNEEKAPIKFDVGAPLGVIHSKCSIEPNPTIVIHEGVFLVTLGESTVELDGRITFEWFPMPKVWFEGTMLQNDLGVAMTFQSEKNSIHFRGNSFPFQLQHTSISQRNIVLRGYLIQTFFEGNIHEGVDEIRFILPNFIDLPGSPVRLGATVRFSGSQFSDDDVSIHMNRISSVKKSPFMSGYDISYCGCFRHKTRQINFQDILILRDKVSLFLSFINGLKTAPILLEGVIDGQVVWQEYSTYDVDFYYSRVSIDSDKVSLQDLYNGFDSFSRINGQENTLKDLIHWYLQALKSESKTSVVAAQVGLETVYNAWVLGVLDMLRGDKAESLDATNKLRLILSNIGISANVPQSIKPKKSNIRGHEFADGPELFVNLRNSIVHSGQKEKKSSDLNKTECRLIEQMGIFYLEVSILKMMGHQGFLTNRVNGLMNLDSIGQ